MRLVVLLDTMGLLRHVNNRSERFAVIVDSATHVLRFLN